MKKVIFGLFITLIFYSCGSLRVSDVKNLSIGMTKLEVDQIMGQPVRVLANDFTQDGVLETYEYVTYKNESYAIEFWNDALTQYRYMYTNANPVPPRPISPPPSNRPPANRPPSRPPVNRPPLRPDNRPPSRPDNRPPTNRPPSPSRPDNGGSRPSERPDNNSEVKPTRPRSTTDTGKTKSENDVKEKSER